MLRLPTVTAACILAILFTSRGYAGVFFSGNDHPEPEKPLKDITAVPLDTGLRVFGTTGVDFSNPSTHNESLSLELAWTRTFTVDTEEEDRTRIHGLLYISLEEEPTNPVILSTLKEITRLRQEDGEIIPNTNATFDYLMHPHLGVSPLQVSGGADSAPFDLGFDFGPREKIENDDLFTFTIGPNTTGHLIINIPEQSLDSTIGPLGAPIPEPPSSLLFVAGILALSGFGLYFKRRAS